MLKHADHTGSNPRHGQKVAGAGLEQFSIKSPHNLLVLEGVDEDTKDVDTMRDEIIMLARDSPIWAEELANRGKGERTDAAGACARWREDIAVQPI